MSMISFESALQILFHIVNLVTFISQVIVLIQVYEWGTILTIIIWCRGKSLGQILHELHEQKAKKFRRIEICNFIVVLLLISILFAALLYMLFTEIGSIAKYKIWLAIESIVSISLTTLFISLVCCLKKYHISVYLVLR